LLRHFFYYFPVSIRFFILINKENIALFQNRQNRTAFLQFLSKSRKSEHIRAIFSDFRIP